MPENEKMKIADAADMIVAGYAYTWLEGNIRVVNLNRNDPSVMVFSLDGKMLESSMDPIEEQIALQRWNEDKEFMEKCDAKIL